MADSITRQIEQAQREARIAERQEQRRGTLPYSQPKQLATKEYIGVLEKAKREVAKDKTREAEIATEVASEIAVFETDTVLLNSGERVSKEAFDNLSTEQQDKLKELGIEGFNTYMGEEMIAAAAEFEAAHVKLNTGEYISRDAFNELPAEDRALLQSVGIEQFNNIKGAESAAFIAAHIKLNTGEYVSKTDFNALSLEDQNLLMAGGIDRFQIMKSHQMNIEAIKELEKTHVLLQSGEYIPRQSKLATATEEGYIGFDDMSLYDQSLLQTVGITRFNAIKQEEFEKDNVLLQSGGYINRGFYNNLTDLEQKWINQEGVAAFNEAKQKEYNEYLAIYNRSIQWTKVDGDGTQFFNIVDAIDKGGFTIAELKALKITDEQIRDAYNREPGFNTIVIPPAQQFAELVAKDPKLKGAVFTEFKDGQFWYTMPQGVTPRSGGYLITAEMEELEPYVIDRGVGGQAEYNIQAYIQDKGVSAETIGVLQNVGYSSPVINAIISLAPYSGDLVQFVRENPQAESIMAAAGFKLEDITNVVAAAKLAPNFQSYMEGVLKTNGISHEDYVGALTAKTFGKAMIKQSPNAESILNILDIVEKAEKAYQDKYGKSAQLGSAAAVYTSFFFAPGRALAPDVTRGDITTAEWIIGAAQVAALGTGFVGVIPKIGGILAKALTGASIVGFPVATAMEWGNMTPAQKIISVSMDIVFTLLMVGRPVGKTIRNNFKWLSNDLRPIIADKYAKLGQAIIKGDAQTIYNLSSDLVAGGTIAKLRQIAGADDIIRQAQFFKKNASLIAKNNAAIRESLVVGKGGQPLGKIYDELYNLTKEQKFSELVVNMDKAQELAAGIKPKTSKTNVVALKQEVRLQNPELMANIKGKVPVSVYADEPAVLMSLDELTQFYQDGILLKIQTDGYAAAIEKYGKRLVTAYEAKAAGYAAAEIAYAQKNLPFTLASRGKGAVTKTQAIQKVTDFGGFMESVPDSFIIKGTGVTNYTKGQMLNDIAKLKNPVVKVMDGGHIQITLSGADKGKLILKYGINPLGEKLYLSPSTMSRVTEIQKGTIKGFAEFGTGERFKAELKRGANWAIEANDPIRNTNKIINDRIFKLDETGNKITLSPEEVARYTYDDLFIEIPTSRLNPEKSLVPIIGNDIESVSTNLVNAIRKHVEKYGFTAAIMMYGEDLVKAIYPQALEAAIMEEEEGNMPNSVFYGIVTPKSPIDPGGGISVATLQEIETAIAQATPIWTAQSIQPVMSLNNATLPSDLGMVTGQAVAIIAALETQEALEAAPTIAGVPTDIMQEAALGELQYVPSDTAYPVTGLPSQISGIEPVLTIAPVTTAISMPVTQTITSEDVAPSSKPAPATQPMPIPLAQTVAIPTPAPIPAPIPIPIPIKEDWPIPIRPPPPLFGGEEDEDTRKREAFRGAVTWKQGIVYHAWKYPYEDDETDLATFYKEPPPGAVIIPGAKTAQETVQLYLGDTPPPPDRIINMGIMDINISTTPDGQLVISYQEDASQARGKKDGWFDAKEKRGAFTSRKKKNSATVSNDDDFWSGAV